MTPGSPNDDHDHDVNPFEAPQMPEPDRPKSLLKRLLPNVFVLAGLFVALVVGVISGFATCASVAVINGDLLPLGALLGKIVTAIVVVSIYRWSVRVGESSRDNG